MLSFQNPFGIPRFLKGGGGSTIKMKSVKIYDIETGREKSTRTLKHLIKLNHAKHSILFHDNQFHNHAPHILGSAYLLSSSPEHLEDIFEEESRSMGPWIDSPSEISTYDWRDFLGKGEYQRAFVDFFEDQLVQNGYDWKQVLEIYLYEGKNPLINCLVAGLGHPLIHLGYAYELSSREVAMEALGMVCTQYSYLHKYLDDPGYTKPSTYSSQSPLEILQKVANDPRFDKGVDSVGDVFKNHESALLEHWNAWSITDLVKQFEASQYAATALLVATHPIHAGTHQDYSFYVVHLLTTSHAIRIILPLIPSKWHLSLLRQWWLITLAVYISHGRPKIDLTNISEFKLDLHDIGREHSESDNAVDWWDTVSRHAIEGNNKWSLDAHYVKALRAMKVAAETWGDPDEYYLKAAVRFDREFDGWAFGTAAAQEYDEGGSQDNQGRGRRGSASGL